MTEQFLHYLWKFRLLNGELYTRSGELLTVIHPGEHNHDGGPDFLNSRIRVGETTWAGNVEIHINEADWFRHNHHLDKSYDNVILHVVYEEADSPDIRSRYACALLTIKGQFPDEILDRYEDFLRNGHWIPCEALIRNINPVHFRQWSYALLAERLANRTRLWKQELESTEFDWYEALHRRIALAMGLRVNAIPFELLAKALPLKIVMKYRTQPFSLESLAFGQAGMLDREFSDEYPIRMQKEYRYLALKHSLKPIDPSLWKFLRLRPTSFPTVRISQWAALLQRTDQLFSLVTECRKSKEIEEFFSVRASTYWETHYLFEKSSPFKAKPFGVSAINLCILNAVAPFLFLYGEIKGIDEYREKAMALIEQMPGEKNNVIECWKDLGMSAGNALYKQALIELKSNYCDKKRCLECRIGGKLLRSNGL